LAGNKNSGRNTILDDELIKEICSFVQGGNTAYRACILCNISEGVFYKWKRQGAEDDEKGIDSIYVKFIQSIKKAEEYFKAFHLKKINDSAASGKIEDSKWLLTRKCPDEFGLKQTISLEGGLNLMKYDIELSADEKEEYDERLKDIFKGNIPEE
jgi:hypothetical protein